MPTPAMNNPVSYYDLVAKALSMNGIGGVEGLLNSKAMIAKMNEVNYQNVFKLGNPRVGFSYKQIKSAKRLIPKATVISYEGGKPLRAVGSAEIQTGSMPAIGHAALFNEKSIEETLQIVNNMNGEANYDEILSALTITLSDLLVGLEKERMWMALQMESNFGKFTTSPKDNPDGLQSEEYDMNIPAEHIKKAGGYGFGSKKKAWYNADGTPNADADPIGDLVAMKKQAKKEKRAVGVTRMSDNTWVGLCEHPSTIKRVALKNTNGQIPAENINTYQVDEDMVKAYLKGLKIPTIEVVEEYVTVEYYNEDKRKIESDTFLAFSDNVVVMRPAGTIGTFQFSLPTKAFGTSANPVYTTNGNRDSVTQLIDTENKYYKYIVESKCLPVIELPDDIFYLKTDEAAA